MTPPPRGHSIAVGLIAGSAGAAASSALAIHVLGPLARHLLGAPLDFDSDYTSREAMSQALAAHFVSVAVVFFLIGTLAPVNSTPLVGAFALANPVTIAVGFGVARQLSPSTLYEYVGFFTWAALSLFAPWIGAAAAVVGGYLRCRKTNKIKRGGA